MEIIQGMQLHSNARTTLPLLIPPCCTFLHLRGTTKEKVWPMGKGTNSGVMHHAKSMIAPPGRGIEWWGRNDACEVTGRDGHAAISGTTRRRDDNNLISSSALHLQLHLTNQTLLNSLEAKYGSTTQAVSRTKRGSSKKLHDHPQAKITSMRHSTSHNSSIHDIGDMHN